MKLTVTYGGKQTTQTWDAPKHPPKVNVTFGGPKKPSK